MCAASHPGELTRSGRPLSELEQRWLKFAEKADGKGPDAGPSRKAPASMSALPSAG